MSVTALRVSFLSKSGQVWGKEDAELLDARVPWGECSEILLTS